MSHSDILEDRNHEKGKTNLALKAPRSQACGVCALLRTGV